MTTIAIPVAYPDKIETATGDLHQFVAALEGDLSLFNPSQLRARLDVLDGFDARFGDFPSPAFQNHTNTRVQARAKALRTRLEAANTQLYLSIRSEMVRDAQPRMLLQWLHDSRGMNEAFHPTPGPGFDYRDEVVSGILQLREPGQMHLPPKPEMVFYQPTPVRHILHLVRISAFSPGDVFMDLGSGLGHVSLLVSMLTGVRSIGIEVEAAYVASAQECARSLDPGRVHFIHQDARAADLSKGTVFYLYSPFTGSILADVLGRLREESTHRQIRICTLGPCTLTIAKESWLKASAMPDPGKISIFQSCL
jgi:hypothetical protein